MEFASADRVQLAYVKEVTAGITPAAGNISRKLRMTGESLAFDLTKTPDSEITADAQPTSSTTTNASAAGDINLHVQYSEYDPLVAGTLRSAWEPFGVNGVGATFTGTFTATTITASAATAGASLFTLLKPGQWFRLNAPGNDNHGKLLRVSTTVAPTSTVLTVDANTPLTVGAGVTNCSIASSRLVNGITKSSFTIEKQATDVNQFFTFRGMHPSKLSMSFAAESESNGSISFMGFSHELSQATKLPGTLGESQPYDIHNGVAGVGKLWENGAPANVTVKSLSIDIDSGLRQQTALGVLGAAGMGIGTIAVTGSISLYFEDGAMYTKYVKDIYTSIIFSTLDADGNGYVFTIPKVMLGQGKVLAGGKNSDLMAEFQIEALADRANVVPALRKTVIIDRVGAAVLPIA